MRRIGGGGIFLEAAHRAGNQLALMEKLHRAMAGAVPQRFMRQRIRSAVEVIIYSDVIVDVDAGLSSGCIFVALVG